MRRDGQQEGQAACHIIFLSIYYFIHSFILIFIYIFLNYQNKNNAEQQHGHKKKPTNNNKLKFRDDVSTLNLNGEVIPFAS